MHTGEMTNLEKIAASDRPLVVDLDRTLLVRDVFHSLSVTHFLRMPHKIPQFLIRFLASGKVGAKRYMAENVEFDIEQHPINMPLLEYLKYEKSKGKSIILCSGADQRHVEIVARELSIFDSYFGTSEDTNLVGHSKKKFLIDKFGEGNFDYIGDSKADLEVAKGAGFTAIIQGHSGLAESGDSKSDFIKLLLKQLRVKHWLKNLLIFIPILTAHQEITPEDIARAALFFVAFSALASGTYILNDLHDLGADSIHKDKRNRPLASGKIKIPTALMLAGSLIVFGLGIASSLGDTSTTLIVIYLCLTTVYSAFLKRALILDIVCLSALYTLRILAGTLLMHLEPTFWILAFSLFMFFSLAAVKRYTELVSSKKPKIPGRGYEKSDSDVVGQLGAAAGFSAIIVFALYINSSEILPYYKHPQYLWFGLVILLYWVSYLWLKAKRGEVNSDPIDWAATDIRSAAAFFSLVVVALAATYI